MFGKISHRFFSLNKVEKLESFVNQLTSKEAPSDAEKFRELLDVLGKDDATLSSISEDCNNDMPKAEHQFEDMKSFENLLEWEDSFSPSLSDYEKATEEDEVCDTTPKKKPKSSSSCDPVSEEARNCYSAVKSSYVCPHCGTERKSTRSMQQHLSWHLKYPNEDFHTSHICKECGKVCADHSLLRAHTRLVHSPRTFICSEEDCSKSFKSKEGLKQHLLVHSGVKNFICSQCGYAVRTKHHLKLHVLKKHTEMKKSIPCEICGKLFRHLTNLKCHQYTHKARLERQYKCEPCSLTFRTQKSLDSHMALHDPSRPHKCNQCPLRYKNKDSLIAHQNTHQNHQFKCELCDIAYTRKDNLKRHMKEKHDNAKST